ncbi:MULTISPECIES: putative bifunctional diguanylate cyclase/phosphodiesterase [Deefgea]|uniref:EAL domain-containing protein n=1 Tax=Deefgea chitinilytica TaxID=570276 RepID=A0ABS2C9X2_9NEIS|nr:MULTISPECIES: GGDEF domain-containing phosphodiesterase [Deefgea]MBM5570817.1 EAL domain-containing protein [Deefgea chitinilytica]MBM9888046.1 EAL domain-containing protein [Deefgea sp. CFH1-16]
MSELDGRLHTAARAIPFVLPEKYVTQALQAQFIKQEDYLKHSKALNQSAKQMGVEHLYVLSLRGADVIFIANSALLAGMNIERDGDYLPSHSERFTLVRSAIAAGQPIFGNIHDQYGRYRSIAMPVLGGDGVVYVLGADIAVDKLLARQSEARIRAFLIGLLMFGFGVLISWLLASQMTAPLRRFSSAVHRFAAGEFDVRMPMHRHDELGNLASAFNAMGDAISAREHLMRQLAFSDRLTGLPNRVKFAELLSAYLIKTPSWLAVVMIDLADFRYINDAFGFDAGDRVLCTMSDRLSQMQPEHLKIVSRISGNSFVLLLSADNETQTHAQIQMIEAALSESLFLGEQKVNVAIRSGIAIYPLHADTAEGLLRHAEVAMFFAKRDRESSVIYDPSREEDRLNQFTLLGDLREALSENHLVVYYQPKINVSTGLVGAAEALVRWQHPSRGWISPGLFIPFAEKTGKLRGITEWVLCEVLRQQVEWQRNHVNLLISVNVGVSDVEDIQFVDFVEEQLNKAGSAANLCLEITETGVMHKPDAMLQNLARLRRLGVQLSIDDFGTGYSSFAYLAKMPVNELKIDQVFVMSMNSTFESVSIVRSMIEIGHILGLKVVAEGVETIGIWQALAVMGCDEVQGYLIAKPMAANELLDWLSEGPHQPVELTPPSMSNF